MDRGTEGNKGGQGSVRGGQGSVSVRVIRREQKEGMEGICWGHEGTKRGNKGDV